MPRKHPLGYAAPYHRRPRHSAAPRTRRGTRGTRAPQYDKAVVVVGIGLVNRTSIHLATPPRITDTPDAQRPPELGPGRVGRVRRNTTKL